MRKILVASALVLSLAIPSFAGAAVKPAPAKSQSQQQTLAVPIYPGATQTMELNVAEKDLLPTFQQVLAMASMSSNSDSGPFAMLKQFDLAGLADALKGIKQIKVVELTLPKNVDSAKKVSDFYSAQLDKETGWSRVFWKSDDPKKVLAVYSRPEGEGIFVTSISTDPKGGKLMIGRTGGRIDLPKVIEWAAKNFTQLQAAKGEVK